MSARALIQKAHELAVLNAAVKEHNQIHGLTLSIVESPDPPDAILSDGAITTWMEHTDAFFSKEWARDLFSHAAAEPHQPMGQGGYVGMDDQLARSFCDLVCDKAAKSSYKPFVERFGPGMLVVSLESPWVEAGTIEAINREWAARGRPDISATFAHVYLGYRDHTGNRAVAWTAGEVDQR